MRVYLGNDTYEYHIGSRVITLTDEEFGLLFKNGIELLEEKIADLEEEVYDLQDQVEDLTYELEKL